MAYGQMYYHSSLPKFERGESEKLRNRAIMASPFLAVITVMAFSVITAVITWNHFLEDCTTDKGFFRCRRGVCIPLNLTCNNFNDCGENSDENSIDCSISRQKCESDMHCSYGCHPTPKGPACTCPLGHHLLTNQTCQDTNELWTNPEHASLIYFSSQEISRYDLSTNEPGSPIVLYKRWYIATAVSLDETYVYWTEFNGDEMTLFRAFRNGTTEKRIRGLGVGIVRHIAVDWITGNIYFIDNYSQIKVCTNSGLYCTSITPRISFGFEALALHPASGTMYVSYCGSNRHIYRADMNGKSRVPIVIVYSHCFDHLTIDYPNSRLYWVDRLERSIESVNLDGTDRRIVCHDTKTHMIDSIAVFGDRLFWTTFLELNGTIYYCDKSNCEGNGTLLQKGDVINGILIDYNVLEPHSHNPCHPNPCEEICLLAGDHKYTCACSPYKTLGDDGKSCRRTRDVNHLIIAAGGVFIDYHHKSLGQASWNRIDTPDHFAEIYNPNNRSSFSNNSLKIFHEISRIHGGNRMIDGVAFDHIGNNVYLADVKHERIETMSLSTLEKTLLPFFEEPRSILLIPERSIMFATLCSESECHIDKMSMTGSERTRFLEDSFFGPRVSLAFDTERERIFWADQATGIIESVYLNGTDRKQFYSNATEPVSLAVFGTEVFWTQKNSSRLFWMNMEYDDGGPQFELMPIEVDIMHLITTRGNNTWEQTSVSSAASGSIDQLGHTTGGVLLFLLLISSILQL